MKIVILNDTRPDMHHGCTRVMRLLEDGLKRHGMTIIACSQVHHDWENDSALRESMTQADLIIINGEGTLHHGKSGAARLLRVTEVAGDVPVALINALYQENPPEWSKWLNRLSYIATRDRRSANEIESVTGQRPVVVPDLTLSARIASQPVTANMVYGDSVKPEISEALANRADLDHLPWVPSLSALKRSKPGTVLGQWLRRWRIARLEARTLTRHPTMTLCPTEDTYADRIASAGLHITGRFHGVCYSMAAGTPFLAIASNSWKIEALISDAGLAPWRVVDTADLGAVIARGSEALAFSAEEQASLNVFLDQAAYGAEAMFSSLRNLAARGS
jgi:hypothetical protein